MVSSPGRPSHSSTAVDHADPLDELVPAPLLADRYVVVERVGEGGMGQVWRGFDVKLERAVALKFLHRGSSGAEAKIVREARAMARLSHPNVLPVFDVVTSDGVTFIVMELVTGHTLKEWLELAEISEGAIFRHIDRHGNIRKRLNPGSVARIVKQAAQRAGLDPALFAAHSLRAGLATAAAAAGVEERDIMAQGRWRSAMIARRYIRRGSLFKNNAAAKVGL